MSKARYIIWSSFFTTLTLNLEVTWRWSANHAGTHCAAVAEINTTISRISVLQLHPFMVLNGTIAPFVGIDLWFVRFPQIHVHFLTPSFATSYNLKIESVQKRTQRYVAVNSIKQRFSYDIPKFQISDSLEIPDLRFSWNSTSLGPNPSL